jgi:hypothetical protein
MFFEMIFPAICQLIGDNASYGHYNAEYVFLYCTFITSDVTSLGN